MNPVILPPGCERLCDETASNRVGDQHENHRYGRRQFADGMNRRGAVHEEHLRLEIDDFLCNLPSSFEVTVGPAIVKMDIAALSPAELLQSGQQCFDARFCLGGALANPHHHADSPHPVGLLRARRQWRKQRATRCHRAATAFRGVSSWPRCQHRSGNACEQILSCRPDRVAPITKPAELSRLLRCGAPCPASGSDANIFWSRGVRRHSPSRRCLPAGACCSGRTARRGRFHRQWPRPTE